MIHLMYSTVPQCGFVPLYHSPGLRVFKDLEVLRPGAFKTAMAEDSISKHGIMDIYIYTCFETTMYIHKSIKH